MNYGQIYNRMNIVLYNFSIFRKHLNACIILYIFSAKILLVKQNLIQLFSTGQIFT